MIPDGHNLLHQTGGYAFVYRPFTAEERASLKLCLLDLPDELFRKAVHQIIDRHIVVADWEQGTEQLPPAVFQEVFHVVTSHLANEKNLFDGACLALEYPHLANTTCRSCLAWWWNPLTGKLHRDAAGNPIRRQSSSVLLCQTPEGCPKGTPEQPTEFTPENAKAFQHYQMAGGQGCPDDNIVRRNWAIISTAETHVRNKRDRTRRLQQHPQSHGGTVGRSLRRTGPHSRHV